jgi:linoleate 10R-lipoxygenase
MVRLLIPCCVQPAFIDAARNLSTVGINDRKLLASVFSFVRLFFFDLNYVFQLEKILTLMSRLPDDSIFSAKLQHFFIDIREFLFSVGHG